MPTGHIFSPCILISLHIIMGSVLLSSTIWQLEPENSLYEGSIDFSADLPPLLILDRLSTLDDEKYMEPRLFPLFRGLKVINSFSELSTSMKVEIIYRAKLSVTNVSCNHFNEDIESKNRFLCSILSLSAPPYINLVRVADIHRGCITRRVLLSLMCP